MFCHLFIFSENTSIPIFEKETCFKECKYLIDGKCRICEKRDEKLVSYSKYSWLLNRVLNFGNDFVSKSGNTKYLKAISLIHPSSADTWIIQCEKILDGGNQQKYQIHIGNKVVELEDIKSINLWLKNNLQYDGRKITEDDFNVKELHHVHN